MADPADSGATIADRREALLGELVTFARSLRRRGAEVSPDATLTAARALGVVGLEDRERVRRALRASLISRRADLDVFEALFPAFWDRVIEGPSEPTDEPADDRPSVADPAGVTRDPPGGEQPSADEAGVPIQTRRELVVGDDAGPDAEESDESAVYSPSGPSERVDAETAPLVPNLEAAVETLGRALASRRGRRWTPGGDTRPNVRRALRRSVETGGTVLELPGRERRESAVRAVLLVDVSRSVLDTIDRGFLVAFLRTVTRAWRDVTVYFFDTSVREVTDAFDAPSASEALSALEAAEAAWGGGTRIGHAVRTVREDHPLVVDRDTVVFVISDGLEVGEIEVLEREMAWLSRRAQMVIWANPLAASTAYEPTCRGMAAALPYLDGLFAFASADDVVELASQLARRGAAGPIGYEYDGRSAS